MGPRNAPTIFGGLGTAFPRVPPLTTATNPTKPHGRNHWGVGGGPDLPPPQIWMDHPNFLDEECDYRYVTHCSARNWVYHPYSVLYNNLDQGIGPPNFENVVAPLVAEENRQQRCIEKLEDGGRPWSTICLNGGKLVRATELICDEAWQTLPRACDASANDDVVYVSLLPCCYTTLGF